MLSHLTCQILQFLLRSKSPYTAGMLLAIYICNCTSVWKDHFSAHNSLAVVETKIELDSHADTYVVHDHCLLVHDHNRPLKAFGYNPKAGLRHAHKANVIPAYIEPQTGQIVVLLINQAIEMKGLDINFSTQCSFVWMAYWSMNSPSFCALPRAIFHD